MAELSYEAFLNALDGDTSPKAPVYLIHGDDFRTEEVCNRLVTRLVGDGNRDLMVERLEGGDEVLHRAVSQLNTYALLAGRKIVVLPDARFFFGKQDTRSVMESAFSAYQKDQKRKAALHVVSTLALKGMTTADTDAETRQALAAELSEAAATDTAWIDDLLDYCREHGIQPSAGDASPVDRLTDAIDKGFPPGHVLIITAERIDKRKAVYKRIGERGVIVDCRLPTGDRMADRKVQAQALAATADRMLATHGKTLAPAARKMLEDRTGFDLRRYAANIEKLIIYVGDRSTIAAEDVRHLVSRTRQDPIYALTAAVAERKAPEAVMCLRRLMTDEVIHPLQALAAIANQVRRLIVARQFIDADGGRTWRADLPYQSFVRQTLPALQAFQEDLDKSFALAAAAGAVDSDGKGRGKKQTAFPAALKPARNPKSPFPAYQQLKQASGFTMAELVAAVAELADGDAEMKRQGGQGAGPLERVIMAIAAPRSASR